MSERSEGRTDWEFGSPEAIGAVPKLIAEIRAAVKNVEDSESIGGIHDEQIVEAYNCIVDALVAFDGAVAAAQNAKDVAE